MKTKLIFIGILIPLLFSSCKKEIFEPEDANPIFTFTGLVDGISTSYSAGENDYYMYSTFYHDANMVYNFDSHLKKYNCTNCTDDIQIIIKDYQTSNTGDVINFSNSISTGFYPLGTTAGSPKSFDVLLNPQIGGSTSSYFWDFGDGTTTTTAPGNITHTFPRIGTYSVCLTVTFTDLTTSTICSEVNVELPDNVYYKFAISNLIGNSVDFTPVQQLGSAATYDWDMGDGNTSTSSTPFTHIYSSPGIYLVKLKVTNAGGTISNFYMNVKTQGFISTNAAFFNYTSAGAVPNPNAFSNVIINYTDANGIIWSNVNTGSQVNSFFKINSIENYMNNENGLPTKKINATFKCNVSDGTSIKTIDNANVVFSIAY